MAALVKAEDTGDRDKHEGLRGRSWGCRDPLALAGGIAAGRGLPASPVVATAMRQGWPGSAPLPNLLLEKAGSGSAGLGWLYWAEWGSLHSATRRASLGKATRATLSVPCHLSPRPLLPHPLPQQQALGAAQAPTASKRYRRGGKQSAAGQGLQRRHEGVSRTLRTLEQALLAQGRAALWWAASLQLCTVCPFPSWERQRGLSQIPPPCPVPWRGVKSRVFPGITILL